MICWHCVTYEVVGYICKDNVCYAMCEECLDLFKEEGVIL